MASQMLHLIFPQDLIKEPVIYRTAIKFNVIPNIRRANVTETVGEVTLELTGEEGNLEMAKRYLEGLGVKVEPIPGDVIE
ncbi:TPA: ferredoxin [Candidatus Poribacteria bacterium]|nr:ferredoxin [Candidatus Poribacteria bacterium]